MRRLLVALWILLPLLLVGCEDSGTNPDSTDNGDPRITVLPDMIQLDATENGAYLEVYWNDGHPVEFDTFEVYSNQPWIEVQALAIIPEDPVFAAYAVDVNRQMIGPDHAVGTVSIEIDGVVVQVVTVIVQVGL